MNDINVLSNILPAVEKKSDIFKSDFHEYSEALQCYWQGKVSEGIERATSYLIKNPDHTLEAAMYRLWVELLRQSGDHSSLRLLDQHLLVLCAESEDCRAYRGIRGMINLELDNWEACELISLSVKDIRDCNYCLEFLQYFYYRLALPSESLPVSLLQDGKDLTDYFHWDSVSDVLIWDERREELKQLRKLQAELWPDSPARNLSLALMHMETSEYSEVRNYTEILHRDFPKNTDFSFLHGYACCKIEQHEEALKAFQAIEEDSLKDPDTTAYRAYCHHMLSANDILSFHWEKALTLYERAKEGYLENGLPVTHVSYLKNLQTHRLKARQSEDILDKRQKIRYWMTPISPLTQGELNTSEESHVQVIYRSIGKTPAPFDLVFMVSEDILKPDTYKLSALYYVAMEAVRHPFRRWESVLHLIKRFASPLNLDLIMNDEKDRRSTPRPDDITRFHMLEIDEAAFDTIRELINEETRFLNEPVDFDNLYAKIS